MAALFEFGMIPGYVTNYLQVETLIVEELSFLKVMDLMIPGCKEWDLELLHDYFNERDVKEITSIPLSQSICSDKQI